MTTITLHDYYNGYDSKFRGELTQAIQDNAARLLIAVNRGIELLEVNGVEFGKSPKTGTPVSSGWRPLVINSTTSGAAAHSAHMDGLAIDLYDPHGEIDEWLLADFERNGPNSVAVALNLYFEHPAATKGWSHWTIRAPRSGNRFFYP